MVNGTVSYRSNNSGGSWWLSDKEWLALADAGWNVEWVKDRKGRLFDADDNGRWLGALATSATKSDTTLGEAIAEWERITGESSAALGCSCCGPPHNFTFEGEDGSWEHYSPDYPTYGVPYGR